MAKRKEEKRRYMAKPKNQFIMLLASSSSLLMGFLFAYSASVQLNDHDWYFWFPLYGLASAVNLLNMKLSMSSSIIKRVSQVVMWVGMLLFAKVLAEDGGLIGWGWSLDMEERVVREKLGSGLVVMSMFLHLQAKGGSASNCVAYGMAALVAGSFSLAFWFFAFVKEYRK